MKRLKEINSKNVLVAVDWILSAANEKIIIGDKMNIDQYCRICKNTSKVSDDCVLCLRKTLNRFDNIKPPAGFVGEF